MDCRERGGKEKIESILALVRDWEPRVKIDLIDTAALKQWHEVVCTATAYEPNLDFFSHFARMFLLPRHNVDPEQLEQFLSSLAAKVDWAIQYVTLERLTSFKEKAVNQSVAIAKEYFGGCGSSA